MASGKARFEGVRAPKRSGSRVGRFSSRAGLLALLVGSAVSVAAAAATPAQAPAVDAGATPAPVAAADPGREAPKAQSNDELARQGEAELQRSVRVFQQRYLMKRHRLELLVGGSSAIADPLVNHWALDAGLLFHLSESWAVGASGFKPFGERSDTFLAIQSDFGLFPERSLIQAAGFAEAQYSPIFGKFSVFGVGVVQMDAYVLAGAGAVRTTVGTSLKPAGLVGAGMRVHALRALTLSLELRDVMMVENFQLGDRFLQHVFVGAKIGIWIPPTVTYRYQR